MSGRRLPWVDRALLAVLLRGYEADVVVGDIVERYGDEIDAGISRSAARSRLRHQVVVSCIQWWRPRAVGERARKRNLEVGRGEGVGSWMSDLRVSARTLRRRPGFAAGVALTLGLGIGATTTVYSVVDGVLLRPLPYEESSRLVTVGSVSPDDPWIDQESGLQRLDRMRLGSYQRLQERTRSPDQSTQ